MMQPVAQSDSESECPCPLSPSTQRNDLIKPSLTTPSHTNINYRSSSKEPHARVAATETLPSTISPTSTFMQPIDSHPLQVSSTSLLDQYTNRAEVAMKSVRVYQFTQTELDGYLQQFRLMAQEYDLSDEITLSSDDLRLGWFNTFIAIRHHWKVRPVGTSQFTIALHIQLMQLQLEEKFKVTEREDKDQICKLIQDWLRMELFDMDDDVSKKEGERLLSFFMKTRLAYGSFKLIRYFHDCLGQFSVESQRKFHRLKECHNLISGIGRLTIPPSSNTLIELYNKIFWDHPEMTTETLQLHLTQFHERLQTRISDDDTAGPDSDDMIGEDQLLTVPNQTSRKRKCRDQSYEDEDSEEMKDSADTLNDVAMHTHTSVTLPVNQTEEKEYVNRFRQIACDPKYGIDLSSADLQCISRLHSDHGMADQWNNHQRSQFAMALNIHSTKLVLEQHQRLHGFTTTKKRIYNLIQHWLNAEVFHGDGRKQASMNIFLKETRSAYGSLKLIHYFQGRMGQSNFVPKRSRLHDIYKLVKTAEKQDIWLSPAELIQFYNSVFWMHPDLQKDEFEQHLTEFKESLGMNAINEIDMNVNVFDSDSDAEWDADETDQSPTVSNKTTQSSRKRKSRDESEDEEEVKNDSAADTGPIPMELDEDDSSTSISQPSRRPRLEPESTDSSSHSNYHSSTHRPYHSISTDEAANFINPNDNQAATSSSSPAITTRIDQTIAAPKSRFVDGPMNQVCISGEINKLQPSIAQPIITQIIQSTSTTPPIHSTPPAGPVAPPTAACILASSAHASHPLCPIHSPIPSASTSSVVVNVTSTGLARMDLDPNHPVTTSIDTTKIPHTSATDRLHLAESALEVMTQVTKELDSCEKERRRAFAFENDQLKKEKQILTDQLRLRHQELENKTKEYVSIIQRIQFEMNAKKELESKVSELESDQLKVVDKCRELAAINQLQRAFIHRLAGKVSILTTNQTAATATMTNRANEIAQLRQTNQELVEDHNGQLEINRQLVESHSRQIQQLLADKKKSPKPL